MCFLGIRFLNGVQDFLQLRFVTPGSCNMYLEVPFRYCNTRLAAIVCFIVGHSTLEATMLAVTKRWGRVFDAKYMMLPTILR